MFQNLPIEQIRLEEMPFYHQNGARNGCTYIQCGAVKQGGNEPYCFTEEKQCAGHICRVLSPAKVIDSCLVIRDDGTVWKIYLPSFQEVVRLDILKDSKREI